MKTFFVFLVIAGLAGWYFLSHNPKTVTFSNSQISLSKVFSSGTKLAKDGYGQAADFLSEKKKQANGLLDMPVISAKRSLYSAAGNIADKSVQAIGEVLGVAKDGGVPLKTETISLSSTAATQLDSAASTRIDLCSSYPTGSRAAFLLRNSDPKKQAYAIRADWGDGQLSQSLQAVFDQSVLFDHQYQRSGNFTVTFFVSGTGIPDFSIQKSICVQ